VSGARPTILILGGINGAGKSTLAVELAAQTETAGLRFLDPDAVASELMARRPGIGPRSANFAALRLIAEIMQGHRRRAAVLLQAPP
jgi:predicted ABC-type ATPase